MKLESIERDFRHKVSELVRLAPEGIERYRVFTPFMFDDGDHLSIVLKHEANRWALSDEGHTYMHLTYWLDEEDLQRGTRQRVVSNSLSAFGVEDREGELVLPVPGGRYGDALYSFVQTLLKIADTEFLSRERVRSTFQEDLNALLIEKVPAERRTFDWNDPDRDPKRSYVVDCRINGRRTPIFVFGLPNDTRVRDATIALHQFERWGLPFESLGIFEDQEGVSRKVLARFTDVAGKMFSSLAENHDRIATYLQEAIRG